LLWAGQLIEQARLAIAAGIEAAVTQGAITCFVDLPGHSHEAHAIPQVVLQGAADAAAQVWSGRLASAAAESGANQSLTGYLDQILPLKQREEAAG
jgi:hypothetical protein